MRFRRFVVLTGLLALASAAPRVAAQSCADFTDVPAADAFCPNVTWLKNRGITLGCTATAYCPNELVSRLSMAAFMNRLGDIVTPTVYSIETSGASLATQTAQQVVCITPVIPGRSYDRVVTADAGLSYDVGGLVDLQLHVVRSVDGGPFTNLAQGASPLAEAGMRNHQHVTLPAQSLAADPARTYRFGLAVVNGGQQPGQNVAAWACHLAVAVINAVQ